MFFDAWWKGVVFGVVNLVGMLAAAYALSGLWKRYEVTGREEDNRCAAGDNH